MFSSCRSSVQRAYYSTATVLVAVVLAPLPGHGHGVGHAPQPLGIIDPLVTHHAVLEDELKLNFRGARTRSDGDEAEVSLEMAYAFTDLVGGEVFVPVGTRAVNDAAVRGLGDVQLQIPKLSIVRRYGFVLTLFPELTLPVGARGRDEERTFVVSPHLLTDVGFGRFGWQTNAAAEFPLGAEPALEVRSSAAVTVELSHARELFLSPVVEIDIEKEMSDAPLSGSGVLGVKVTYGGWHVGAGAQLPVAGPSEVAAQLFVQLGYHVNWQRLVHRHPSANESDTPPS